MRGRQCLFRAREKCLVLGGRTRIMGIVNVTPDSFSDGGLFMDADVAVDHALTLVDQGADIIDIGGESTRPGAAPVEAEVEWGRIGPVLQKLRSQTDALISVDTYKASVAQRSLETGADIINDVGALRLDTDMAATIGRWGAGVVLMHMRGTPENMQKLPPSPDILKDIVGDFRRAIPAAQAAGIAQDQIILDPGLGFGKTAEDNLKILHRLSLLEEVGYPILIGPSRKSFLGKIAEVGHEGRDIGTAVSVVVAALQGVDVVRVHDVRSTRIALNVAGAIQGETLTP